MCEAKVRPLEKFHKELKVIGFNVKLHLQLSGGESLLDNSAQVDQLVTEKSELQSKAEQVSNRENFSSIVNLGSELLQGVIQRVKTCINLSKEKKENIVTKR